jgi:hypothetical protein
MPQPDTTLQLTRRVGVALALAASSAIAGFTALGSIFAYPQILHEPVDDVLALFRDHQGPVMLWFGVLALGAALLAPAGVWLGRLIGGRVGRALAVAGVAAAVVQVVGLQRWITIVPALARDALDPARHDGAVNRFAFWHTLLGQVIGETVGYALTGAFTALVVIGLADRLPRSLAVAGWASAALIVTGVVIPVLPAASLTNFAGYVLWCGWLIALSVILIGSGQRRFAVA